MVSLHGGCYKITRKHPKNNEFSDFMAKTQIFICGLTIVSFHVAVHFTKQICIFLRKMQIKART